jgi:hypothetical protein
MRKRRLHCPAVTRVRAHTVYTERICAEGVKTLSQLSNIGKPGRWLFRVDQRAVEACPRHDQRPPYCDAPSDGSFGLLTGYEVAHTHTHTPAHTHTHTVTITTHAPA